ncbi:hypothetical protein I6F11_27410 [Ensifer sp. NBAIM29]|nr:hypothetical protein [Ensifer sp. NBAIM29]
MLDKPVQAAAEGLPNEKPISLIDAEDCINCAINLAHALMMAAEAIPDRAKKNAISTIADMLVTQLENGIDHLEVMRESLK